ncbi:MAG: twin-arginine translocase TatA/TatE family subunit [Deltaproteobacteria bacterium]|nr:twin-arginine translocase TatA/TatE family subunit [Deltaproteobacteria bacterium]
MFGIGMTELIVIMVVLLVVIGPSKLPELAKALGKGLAEFRKASQEIKDSLNLDDEIKTIKKDTLDSINDFKNSLESDEDEEDKESGAADEELASTLDADDDKAAETEKKETPANE